MSVESAQEKFLNIAQKLNDLLLLDANEMFHGILAYESFLAPLRKEEFTSANYVHGCISNAYVLLETVNGRAKLRGHSDAMVVRGLIGILATAFAELSAQELAQHGMQLAQNFISTVKIHLMLSPTRANAFGNVIKHIIEKARLEQDAANF